MKKCFIVIAFVGFVLSACAPKVVVPDDVLSDSTMTKLLIDIAIIDAAHNVGMNSPDLPRFRPELFYEEVLIKHNTNRDQLVKSIQFYSSETGMLKKIYEEALIEISREQAESTN